MEELYEYGNIHVMDISNFSEDSDFLILNTEIVLAINQVELHSFYHQVVLKKLMWVYGV